MIWHGRKHMKQSQKMHRGNIDLINILLMIAQTCPNVHRVWKKQPHQTFMWSRRIPYVHNSFGVGAAASLVLTCLGSGVTFSTLELEATVPGVCSPRLGSSFLLPPTHTYKESFIICLLSFNIVYLLINIWSILIIFWSFLIYCYICYILLIFFDHSCSWIEPRPRASKSCSSLLASQWAGDPDIPSCCMHWSVFGQWGFSGVQSVIWYDLIVFWLW